MKNLIIKLDYLPDDISLNQLYTLFLKNEGEDITRNEMELEDLQIKKYIKITDYDEWSFEFRSKATDLMNKEIISFEQGVAITTDSKIEKLVQEFRLLFKKTGVSGKTADIRTTTKKLEWFLKEYPENSHTLILKATAKYIDQESLNGFKYLQRCDYFISKEDTSKIKVSRLATYCEEIEDNYEAESDYGTFNKLL